MSFEETVSVSDAPGKSEKKPSSKASRNGKDNCPTCGVSLATHLGRPGPGNCFGMAVTKAFADLLSTVQEMKTALLEERSAAADREVRLNKKLSAMSKELTESEEAIDALRGKIVALERKVSSLEPSGQISSAVLKDRNEPLPRDDRPHSGKTSKRRKRPNTQTNAKSSVQWSDFPSAADEEETLAVQSVAIVGDNKGDDTHCTVNDIVRQKDATSDKSYEPFETDDETWQLVVSSKPAEKKSVLYIGNLSSSTSEESLRKFIERRSESVCISPPRIYNCRVFSDQSKERPNHNLVVGARITVPASAQNIVMNRTFWPRPVYARPWIFKDRNETMATGALLNERSGDLEEAASLDATALN